MRDYEMQKIKPRLINAKSWEKWFEMTNLQGWKKNLRVIHDTVYKHDALISNLRSRMSALD